MQAFLKSMEEATEKLATISTLSTHHHARSLIYQRDKVSLFHYHSLAKSSDQTPILIVFSMLNRPDILELMPNYSFISELLAQGLDVYLLDWGYPDQNDLNKEIEAYITSDLHHCVQAVLQDAKQSSLNMIGICQGGVLSLCYTALFNTIKKLVLLSTPIDFHSKDNLISIFARKLDIPLLTELNSNIPGKWLPPFFISLRPFELVGKKYINFIKKQDDASYTEKFLRIEKWLQDVPDQSLAAFTQFIERFYQQNQLANGKLVLQNKKINLSNIRTPLFNIMASHDVIVPVSASRLLRKKWKAEYKEQIFEGGHISIYVSNKTIKILPVAISEWLKKP